MQCNGSLSAFYGSMLYNARVTPYQYMVMIVNFLQSGKNVKHVARATGLTPVTVSRYYGYFRSVAAFMNPNELIGGPGITVEIDECLLMKRKYHRGRNPATGE